jgi:hypothetical protein
MEGYMRNAFLWILTFFAFSMSSVAIPVPSYALDDPIVMFFGQKEFPESLSRNSRVFKRAQSEVMEILQQEFDLEIKNEASASMDTYNDSGGRRSKQELAEIARQADANVAVIFQVTPWVEDVNGFKKVKAQINIEAFFTDESSRQIGMVDVNSEVPVNVRAPFKKAQIQEAAGEAVQDIAAQAADELGAQLMAHLDRQDEKGGIYTIVFKKFKADEIEDTLDAFSQVDGYVKHRQLKKTARSAKVEYHSTADISALTSEFELIMKDLQFPVTTSTRGSNIIFSKARVRKSRR